MKIEGDTVIFSTGKTSYANCGIIGLSPRMDVSEGYDGGFYNGPDSEDWKDEEERLTKAELIELADYMIEQWQKFRSLQESNAHDKRHADRLPTENTDEN